MQEGKNFRVNIILLGSHFISLTKSTFTISIVLYKSNKDPKIQISGIMIIAKHAKDKWNINSLARM